MPALLIALFAALRCTIRSHLELEAEIVALRRECLDHIIVWNERSLRRHLRQYPVYYHKWRTHLSLDKDAPDPRAAQPPTCGTIVQIPHLGGLHHHDERRAA